MDPYAQTPPPPPPPPAPEGWTAPPGPTAPPGWTAPQPSSTVSKLARFALPVLAIVLVGGGLFAFRTLTDGPAKIVFTTTDTSGYEGCQIKDTVDKVTSGTDVWMVINFKSTMDKSEVTVSVTKDGETYDDWSYDVADTEKADCFGDVDPFNDLDPGVYKFTANRGDKVEAEGTLTVQ